MPRDVSFHRSLVLDGAQPRTVQLVLREEPSGRASFDLQGMDSAAAGTQTWSLLANGVIEDYRFEVGD